MSSPEMPAARPGFRCEPSARWVRVTFAGVTVADSRQTMLVWDQHHIPAYFFPRQDIRLEALSTSGRGRGGQTRYNVTVGQQTAENGAWGYDEPDARRRPIHGYVTFRWSAMDAWFEEATQIYVHPRDPHKRVDALPSTRHVQVRLAGETVAASVRPTLLFETGLPTRYYLPPADVRQAWLTPTDSRTQCPYKGVASYWSVTVNDTTYPDLVWGYPAPIPECPAIKGLLCFYNEKVDLVVDGVRQERPRTAWS